MAYDLGHELIFVAYDGDDPNGSPLGTISDASEMALQKRHNAPGSGEFKISRHSTNRTITQPDTYIRCYRDSTATDPIFAFFITESQDTVLGPGEQGVENMSKKGEGALSYMADAIVWYEAVTSSDAAVPGASDDMWHWVNVHPGGILVRMIEEAVARGCYPDLTYDFTRTTDSNGNPWTFTIEDFQVQVGTDLLTLMGYLQTLGLVFVMDHDLVLHAYEATSYGTDRSATVTFTKGIDIMDTADRHQVSAPARSTVLVKGARADNNETAWVEADSAAGLLETGRRKEGFFDAQATTHFDALQNIGLEEIYQKLRLKAGPTNLVVLPLDSQVPIDDYDVGDLVTVDVPGIWNEEVKQITYIGFRQTDAGEYDVTVGFEDGPSLRSLATLTSGPQGVPPLEQECCPPPPPFLPGDDSDCSVAGETTLSIGSVIYGYGGRTIQYGSQIGMSPITLTNGQQYRIVMTIVDNFNSPLQGYDNTTFEFGVVNGPASGVGPVGMTDQVDTDDVDYSGINASLKQLVPFGTRTCNCLDPGEVFTTPWAAYSGSTDTDADLYIAGTPSSGFYGGFVVATVRLETRNGDGSAIDCDTGGSAGTPSEGQTTGPEQAVETGLTRHTNYPYIPGSLRVWVGGVLVTVTESDPATGEFILPFDPGSHRVIVVYQSTGGASLGTGNVLPGGGIIDQIPDEVLPPSTGLPYFDVTDYGATGDGTTDDTSSIQDAIDAAEAAGGGIVYFPKGIYKVAGALADTSRSNSQLVLPIKDAVDDEQITIVLLGEFPPPPIFSVVGATPLPDNHVVIKGTLTSVSGTSPSLLGGWGPSGSFDDLTFIQLRIENIAFRLPENPVYTALNLSHVTGVDLDNVVCDVSDYQIQGITEPTTSTSFGIRLPAINNGAYTRLGAVNVAGYYKGIEVGEHTIGQQVTTWGCKQGLVTVAGYHASHFDRFMAVHCERGIVATGGIHYLSIDQYNIEHAASGWWVCDYDVDDASNYLKGRVEWKVTLAGVGHDSTWTVNGATNLIQTEMGTSPGGSSLTIKEEGTPLTTAATSIDFVGAGITATGATAAKTVTLAVSLDNLTDAVITSPVIGDRLRYDGTNWVNSPLIWRPVTTYDPTSGLWVPLVDGSGNAIMAEA